MNVITLGDVWPDKDLQRHDEFMATVESHGLDSAVFHTEEGVFYVDRHTLFHIAKGTHFEYHGVQSLTMPQKQIEH